MTLRFWCIAALFHLAVGPATLAVGWVARGRWWNLLLGLPALGLVTMVAALVFGELLPDSRFATIRFLAQALFAEVPLLAAWLAIEWARRARPAPAALAGLACLALLAVYWQAYHVTPYDLHVRHHTLDLAHGRSHPAGRTLRVLHLSDIQVWRVGDYERRVVREAVEQKPDLIVMTGDYVHPRLTPDRARLTEELRQLFQSEGLGAPLGTFAVGGDTDGGQERIFEGLPIRWLSDESATVVLPGAKRLVLIGLSRPLSRMKRQEDPRPVIAAAPEGDLRFVLGHGPDYVMALAGHAHVDLAFAGHTHGGQVALPFVGPPMVLTRLPRRLAAA